MPLTYSWSPYINPRDENAGHFLRCKNYETQIQKMPKNQKILSPLKGLG